MAEEHLKVWTDAVPTGLDVHRFAVTEATNRPFLVELFLRTHDQAIDLEKIVNQPASFRMSSGYTGSVASERTWTGVCTHFELVQVESKTATKLGKSTYFMRLEPKLAQLKSRIDDRVFLHKTVVEIVKAVLAEWEITPELKLTRPEENYKPLEYVVQYEETDLAFVSRLLEDFGITYYFKHVDGPTVLCLCDEPHRSSELGDIVWEDRPTRSQEIDFVTNLRIARQLRPGRVTLRDFDFRAQKKDFSLSSTAPEKPKPGIEKFFEQYRYVPGAFRVKDTGSEPEADENGNWPFRHTIDEGKRRAERDLHALQQGKRRVNFDTNCVGLAPGSTFSVGNHPREDDLDGKPLLVTEVQLDGDAQSEWLFSAEAVFCDVPFVPMAVTPRPRIPGVQTAVVVGKDPAGKSPEIDPDEYGRVRVQFHWDRRGKFDRASSSWVRVSQQWAGPGFGAMFLPRVKNEVLVGYFDGNPDMPVVIGRSYDLTRPLPYKLPDHDRKVVWKTKTSPEQTDPPNAYNELRFDDVPEDELVYVQAQRDHQVLVKGKEAQRTGISRVAVVGENRTSIVRSQDVRMVGGKYNVQVIKEPDEGKTKAEEKTQLKIIEQKTPTIEPLPTKFEMVDGQLMATSGDATFVMKKDEITFVACDGEISFKAGGSITAFGGPKVKINC